MDLFFTGWSGSGLMRIRYLLFPYGISSSSYRSDSNSYSIQSLGTVMNEGNQSLRMKPILLVLTSKLGKAYPRPSPSSYPNQMSSPFRPNSMPVGSESRIQLLNLTHETQSDYVDLNLTIRERSKKDPFLFK